MSAPNAIVNTNLAGFTVTYNDVQFGGADADSPYRMTPPLYGFRGTPKYDESGRAVKQIDCLLSIRAIVFGASESDAAFRMKSIQDALSVPGKLLTIVGLGIGFGNIGGNAGGVGDPTIDYYEINQGPKPGTFEANPIGNLAWEFSWSVEFSISRCVGNDTDQLAFTEFNFSTSWRNDFEGISQRVITGFVTIAKLRNNNSPKAVIRIADETRGNIIVAIPPGFARIENSWSESLDKSRLDFNIVDELIDGDYLPPGITAADGNFSFQTGDKDGVFAKGIATLSMSLKTAINQPKNLAGQIFFTAAMAKQNAMRANFDNEAIGNSPQSIIIPIRFSISHGLFGKARQTDCSISWAITSCFQAMLSSLGIWEPVAPNNYNSWKTSMANLWGNRGFANLASVSNEAVIIDLCDNIVTKTIGVQGSGTNNPNDVTPDSFACPTIPVDGGWLGFQLRLTVHQQDTQTLHKKAAIYLPADSDATDPGYVIPGDNDNAISLGNPAYSQSDEHLVEYQGYPEVLVAMQFKGLRYKYDPIMPKIQTIGGSKVVQVGAPVGVPEYAFDVFGCPVKSLSGYRVYRVLGPVPAVKSTGSKTSCGAPLRTDDLEKGLKA